MIDLQILTNNFTDISICQHLSDRIRSVKISPKHEAEKEYLEGNELDWIIRIFGANCQNLSANLHSPIDTIVLLLRDMQQLHSLHVIVQTKNNTEITNQWLARQQIGLDFSNCYIFNYQNDYHFWLDK